MASGLGLLILIVHIRKTYSVGQKKKPSNLKKAKNFKFKLNS
jgi:hypothetical protein